MASLSELDLIKASQLEELTEVTDSNYVVVTDGATSKKVKATNLKGNSLTSEQAQQLSEAYAHSQAPHVSVDDIPTNISDLKNDSDFVTNSKMLEAIANAQLGSGEGSDIDLSAYQPIEESTLTTTAKTIPTAINELKSGLDGITVPTKVSDLENDENYISSIPSEYVTETKLKAKGYLTSHQDISGLQPKTDNNLATTSKEVVGAINEIKSLNDTKLNKTDANKLNCITIDNVSLKEYILTNFKGTEKTYYIIAKTTCTDLPKASNFFITVETPGMYTYKVTAKELNDSNGIYICTYRTISSTWTKWEKVCTTTVADGSGSGTISNDATGDVSYKVINGIAYVSVRNLADGLNGKDVCSITGIPKASMYINVALESSGSRVGTIYTEDGINFGTHKSSTSAGYGSFSYPVAES